jgi:hypothetical protein
MVEVNSLWIGDRLSNLEILSIVSHLKVGHLYTLWTYGHVARIPDGVTVRDAREIMPESDVFAYEIGEGKGSYSACSNLFRYKLLSELDVWWVDTDVVALRPFSFSEPVVFASERNRNGSPTPTTCVIKMNRMVACDCYNLARQIASDRSNLAWGTIGPKLLTRIVFTWPFDDLSQYIQSPDTFCPVNWFDAEFDPPVSNPSSLERSYAVHLWHEMWRRRGLDKDGVFDKNSIYERLKDAILYTR